MSEKKQVLIICHTAAGQMYLGVLLNRIWYSPVLAKTAEDGVRIAQKSPFSLVLFDGDVSEIELRSAISLLRTAAAVKDLPLVIFITNENAALNESLLSQGCSAILTKPLDLAFVYAVLARLSGQPRHTPRIPVKIRVELDVEINEGIPEKVLTCVNLSESGMYLRTHKALPEGAIIHLKFNLPRDTASLQLTGEVVRTAPLAAQIEAEPGMGLRFVDLPETIRLQLRNFVQWEMMGDLEWNANF